MYNKEVNFNSMAKPRVDIDSISRMASVITKYNIHTVCMSALCPNISTCFSKKMLTFMLLGNICTRQCQFCAVEKGLPREIDPEEPYRIKAAIIELGLKYIVITSVTRDDLIDGGAAEFAKVTNLIKELGNIKIELLVPDFRASLEAIHTVIEASPDVIGHNIETVPRLYDKIRPEANYEHSLQLLYEIKKVRTDILTKSGIMVGMGETETEVIKVLNDLNKVKCDFVTIGQYLRPSKRHYPVQEYVTLEKFNYYNSIAQKMTFKNIFTGPYIRSSYCAAEQYSRNHMLATN